MSAITENELYMIASTLQTVLLVSKYTLWFYITYVVKLKMLGLYFNTPFQSQIL